MSGWGARLKLVLNELPGFKYAKSKDLLGRHASTVFEYEKEIRSPDIGFLIAFKEQTGVSIDWLATGKGLKGGGLDRSALQTAVTAALKIVESARAQGRQHQTEDVINFIVGIYESVINTPLDDNNPIADSEGANVTKEGPHARHRKANP